MERDDVVTSYYQEGRKAGTSWIIGTPLPEPPHYMNIYNSDDSEKLSLWFTGLNAGIQQRLINRSRCVGMGADNTSDDFKSITYKLARIVRGTDCIYPSDRGIQIGQLLVKLRILDGERYDREVIAPKIQP